MNTRLNIDRRSLLRIAGLGTATLLAGSAKASALEALSLPTSPGGIQADPPDVEIALTAAPGTSRLFSGAPTRTWNYRGRVLRGHPGHLVTLANSHLGPIIRVQKGQRVRIHFRNLLPEATNIHWHGLRVPAEMDGHPGDLIEPRGSFTYDFPVLNRAGTYWYHPHPEMRTAEQVYRGLVGLFIVSDEEEAAAGLPSGPFDLPLVIQDRKVERNQFVYPGDEMTRMMGFLGNRVLVNGRPNPTLNVVTRPYRLRLLNGSNSRVYKLAWADANPLTVIATDGGLLAQPVERDYVTLGPGERVELWVDFRGRRPGTLMELRSLEFHGVHGDGGMGGMRAQGTGPSAQHHHHMEEDLAHGAPFPVMRFRVTQRVRGGGMLPATLSTIDRYEIGNAVNGAAPRTFGLTFRNGQWGLNGRTFAMEEVASDETVGLNTLEAWEFVNELNPGDMMEPLGMVHPMHIHGVQFHVVERQVMPALAMGWESVSAGYVDEGWKDTVLVMPGERVKLLMRFADSAGRFTYHCHNLEHEDMGMMRNYLIQP